MSAIQNNASYYKLQAILAPPPEEKSFIAFLEWRQLLRVDWVEVPAGIKSCEVKPKLNELLAMFMLIPLKLLETFFKIRNTTGGGNTHFRFQDKMWTRSQML